MNDKREVCFEDPRSALKRHGLQPKHSWGQNFLVSPKAVLVIADACLEVSSPKVVEIGAGLGTLTSVLLQKGLEVIAVERDRDMCNVLRADLSSNPNFTLIEEDAAKVDFAELFVNQKGVIAGNLPYQITGRLLRSMVESYERLVRAVLMVQEEVANRLIAPPKTSARGALSVIVQSRFSVKVAIRLKPTAFHPAPKVRSAVLTFDPLPKPLFSESTTSEQFDRLVNAAFCSRRKTIRNSLATSSLNLSTSTAESLLSAAAVVPTARPEELTVEEFARLADAAVALRLL
jgi:16S rRNA (adenine1518-N6/adenine1519-N6)-dimethyltransferase